jgi:sterol desaturase/sphingolipid hydroxylase (fatty acid hydroxylase superfamily)
VLSRSLFDGNGAALVGLLLVLFLVAGAELWRPLHAYPAEPKGRIPSNIALGLINAAIALLLPISTIFAAEWAARNHIGLMNGVPLPFLAAAAVTVVARSLAGYAIHRLSHHVPLFWRVHRVHHSDTLLDLSTGLRNHPLELAFVAPWLAGAAILLGFEPSVLVVYEAAALAFALWDHANLGLPLALDRALRLIFVTPAMHHVHHSAERRETDSNYGDVFSVWDRLFGTYRDLGPDGLRTMRIGLGGPFDAGASSLAAILGLPIRNPSEARQEGGEIGSEGVDRVAALHHHDGGQP